MKSLRVMLISPSFPPLAGGISDYVRCLADAMSEQATVHVITSRGLGETAGAALKLHPVIEAWNWSCVPTLFSLIRSVKPDAVLFQDGKEQHSDRYTIMLVPALIKTLLNIPCYLIVHELEGRRQMLQAAWSSGVIGVEASYEVYFQALAKKGRFHWVPIGSNVPRVVVDQATRSEWRSRCGAGAGTLLIGYFGFLSARKGFDALLKAALEIGQTRSVRVLAIGRAASEIGLASGYALVHTTGYLTPEQSAIALSCTDVNVFPFVGGAAWRYGSLLAALMQDVPVVTTPGLVRKIPGVVEATATDPSSLSRAIETAASMPRCERNAVPSWSKIAESICDIVLRNAA